MSWMTLKFIIKANEPTVLAQGGFERLKDIGRKLFQHPSGIQPLPEWFEVGSLWFRKITE